jgi:hypothetical protein
VGDHELFPANQDDIPAARKTADLHGAIFLPASLEVVKIYNLFMTSGDTKSLAEGKPCPQAEGYWPAWKPWFPPRRRPQDYWETTAPKHLLEPVLQREEYP